MYLRECPQHGAQLSSADAIARQQTANVQIDQQPGVTFQSEKYPSVYRETIVRKDDRGKYIDPFKNIATKPYGRRLMYDDTHPQKM